jgi:hypothetical protein
MEVINPDDLRRLSRGVLVWMITLPLIPAALGPEPRYPLLIMSPSVLIDERVLPTVQLDLLMIMTGVLCTFEKAITCKISN